MLAVKCDKSGIFHYPSPQITKPTEKSPDSEFGPYQPYNEIAKTLVKITTGCILSLTFALTNFHFPSLYQFLRRSSFEKKKIFRRIVKRGK